MKMPCFADALSRENLTRDLLFIATKENAHDGCCENWMSCHLEINDPLAKILAEECLLED